MWHIRGEEKRNAYGILVRKSEAKEYIQEVGVDGG
jgi:hypothetical protein